MEIYLPSDQPECCPKCGTRATLDFENDKHQIYHCPDIDCSDVWEVDLTEEVAGTNELE